MQFGAKLCLKTYPLNLVKVIALWVNWKANGCGKSTFMKILDGSLAPSSGNVSITPNERIGKVAPGSIAFEQHSVVDTVIMGHSELWQVKQERDRLYSLPEMSDEEGMRVADLEIQFAEMDGYSAESRAGNSIGAGIAEEFHFGPMSEVAPGWKLRVLLAQALFSDPDILLLERTNQQPRHQYDSLVRGSAK